MNKRLCEIILCASLAGYSASGCGPGMDFLDYQEKEKKEEEKSKEEKQRTKDACNKFGMKVVETFFKAAGEKIKERNKKIEETYLTKKLDDEEEEKLEDLIGSDFRRYCRLKTGSRDPGLIRSIKKDIRLGIDDPDTLARIYVKNKESDNPDFEWGYEARTRVIEKYIRWSVPRKDFGVYMIFLAEIKEIAPDFYTYIESRKRFEQLPSSRKEEKKEILDKVKPYEDLNPLWDDFYGLLRDAENDFLDEAFPLDETEQHKEAEKVCEEHDFQAYYLKKIDYLWAKLDPKWAHDMARTYISLEEIDHKDWKRAHDYFQKRSIKEED